MEKEDGGKVVVAGGAKRRSRTKLERRKIDVGFGDAIQQIGLLQEVDPLNTLAILVPSGTKVEISDQSKSHVRITLHDVEQRCLALHKIALMGPRAAEVSNHDVLATVRGSSRDLVRHLQLLAVERIGNNNGPAAEAFDRTG